MKTDYPKLREYLRSLKTAEAQEAFARRCNTSLGYLRKAMSKGARMDVKLVESLVEESNFFVPPDELRDDVNWSVFVLERAAKKIPAPSRAVKTTRPKRSERPVAEDSQQERGPAAVAAAA